MATTLKQHKWERLNDGGKLTYVGTLLVVFDRDGDPSGWTHKAAEEFVVSEGYTSGSDPPDGESCPLRTYRTVQHAKAKHIWICTVTYKTDTPSMSEQEANYEQIEIQGGSKTVTEYFDTDGNALDNSDGKHGVPKQVPTKVIRVHRVHSASKSGGVAGWETSACKTNSDTVTTPGGVTLCSTAGKLLFLYATERKLATSKYEVVYVFVEDLGRYRDEGGWVNLLHQEPVATVNKSTGKVTAVTLKTIYERVALSSVMADE